jgi:PAS domain S-box-containing protein
VVSGAWALKPLSGGFINHVDTRVRCRCRAAVGSESTRFFRQQGSAWRLRAPEGMSHHVASASGDDALIAPADSRAANSPTLEIGPASPAPIRQYDAGAAFEHVAAMCRDYVLVVGVDGRILYVNPAAQIAFNLDRDPIGPVLASLSIRFPLLGPLETLCQQAAGEHRVVAERIDPFTFTVAPLNGADDACQALSITIQIAGPNGELLTAGLQSRVQEQAAALAAARQELHYTESRFRMAVEATGIGTWSQDLFPEVHSYWSDQMYAIYDVAKGQEVTSDICIGYIHLDDRADVDAALKRSFDPNGDGRYVAEFRICRKNGSVVSVLSWGKCEFDASSGSRRPVRIVGFTLDVTDRARAETERARLMAQIDKDQALLRAVVDQMPAGVLVAEAPSGRIVLSNAEAERAFGQPTMSAIRTDQYQALKATHTTGRPYVPADWPLARTLKTGRPVLNQEVMIESPDGEQRAIAMSSSPVVDASGNMSAVVVVDHDITDRKRIEQVGLRFARRQEALASLSNAALMGGDMTPLFAAAAEVIRDTIGADFSVVAERTSDESACVVRASAGWPKPVNGAPLGCPCAAMDPDCLCADEPRVVGDMVGDFRAGGTGLLAKNKVVAGVVLAIRSVDRRFGTLGAFSQTERSFTVDEIGFLSSVANVLAMTMQRQRDEELEARKAAAIVRTLNTMGARAGLESMLVNVLEHLKHVMRCHSVAFWHYDRNTHAVTLNLTVTDQCTVRGAEPGHPTGSDSTSVEQVPMWPRLRQSKDPIWFDLTKEPDAPNRDWYLGQGVVGGLVLPMLLGDELIGWTVARSTSPKRFPAEDIRVAQALVQQAAIAVYMERLAEQGRRAAVLEERNRMAREIHDTLAQGFTAIALQLETARISLDRGRGDVRDIIAKTRDLARQNLAEARRSVWALKPQLLEDGGLPDAFRGALATVTRGTSVAARFELHGSPRNLPEEVEQDTLRIGIEAATNSVKHSGASTVHVDLTYGARELRLKVRDNGAGFDMERVTDGSFGMTSMRQRAVRLGGKIEIVSAPGKGTELELKYPLT